MPRIDPSARMSGLGPLLCAAVLALAPLAHAATMCLEDGAACYGVSDCCGVCDQAACPPDAALQQCSGLCRSTSGSADADAELYDDNGADDDEEAGAVCAALGSACGEGVECCNDVLCDRGVCAARSGLMTSSPRKLQAQPVPNQPKPCKGRRKKGKTCMRWSRWKGWHGKRKCKPWLRCAWWRRNRWSRWKPICRPPPHKAIYLC